MALNYEVKKRVFGFDETKTEKYVAQMKTLGVVGFKVSDCSTTSCAFNFSVGCTPL